MIRGLRFPHPLTLLIGCIITAAALFSFYARLNLANTFFSIIMAHVVLGAPFVVITVTAAPNSRHFVARCLPMKPVPPTTSTLAPC